MSNYLKSKTLYGDTLGFLAKKRINVVGLTWVPNTAGDALTLSFFEENGLAVAQRSSLITVSSSSVITGAHDDFPSTYAAGCAAFISKVGSQDKSNEGLHLIVTAGDDDHFHTEADLVDIVDSPVAISCLSRRTFQTMFSAAKDAMQFHFDKDTWLPNLAITSIATSGIVLVQIG
jgi:hypothetical protein